MEGERRRRRRSFKERLGFKVMGCCGGSKWGFGSTTMSLRDEDEAEIEEEEERVAAADPGCVNPAPVPTGMNLAAALAAERHYWASGSPTSNVGGGRTPGTPLRGVVPSATVPSSRFLTFSESYHPLLLHHLLHDDTGHGQWLNKTHQG
ncbi:hypothetical protein Gotri_006266, partial [Gossypium trilobum]|nr:hypothetical protein [Gossypium trilobum]